MTLSVSSRISRLAGTAIAASALALSLAAFGPSALAQPAAKAAPGSVHAPGYPKAILRGDYADPTILRDGDDFYMTHSAFDYAPGLLIWHSKDLVHWTPIARPLKVAIGVYAPELVKVKGKFYIYYPSNGSIWVITADEIRGPWSEPVSLNVKKIDPGYMVGEDGKRYLFVNGGLRARLSDDGLKLETPLEKVYEGWEYPSGWATECMCLESPKLIKRGEYFYTVSAQGGTAGPPTSHMAVVARSKSIHGPWVNSPYNPLVHTYSRKDPWWSKGHSTLIDDPNGNWWMIHHAYENSQAPLGRMTLLDPIDWTPDGWPVLAKAAHPLPGKPTEQTGGGLPLSDTFNGPDLGLQWTSWKELSGVTVHDGALRVAAKGQGPSDARQMIVTPTDGDYEISADVTVPQGATAGLLLFYNAKALAGFTSDGKSIFIHHSATDTHSVPNPFGRTLKMKIVNRSYKADFLISKDGKAWTTVATGVDVSNLHHNNYGGFLALKPTLSAYGTGEVSFDNFVYQPLSRTSPGT